MPSIHAFGLSSAHILGVLPAQGDYFSIIKIILFLAAIILWSYATAWVQTASRKVKIHDKKWVYLTFGAGTLGVLAWLLVPWFWIGLAVFAALFGAASVGYSTVYNKRVPPAQAILTMAHLKRLGKGGGGPAKKPGAVVAAAADLTERTRIKNSAGKTPPWPTVPEERAAYQALQDLLFDAIWRRASEVRLDLIPQQPLKIIYKVDGFERAREPISAEQGPLAFRQLKVIAGMDPEEHRRPQQGRFKTAIGAGELEKKIDLDARASGSTAGQRMIMRLISEESKFRLSGLGLTKEQLAAFEKFVHEQKGVLICSSPRGNGLTSTLYAILRSHDAFMQHIHTLEIAKDMDLENITQHVYEGQASGVSFGKKFRSILRAEPDVCMACDMPDADTATSAAAAVRQGKKLYLGMQARDCFSALRRYLEGVGDQAVAASGLIAVTNQRLARILCTQCRRAYKPDPKLLKKGNLPMDENRPFYRPPNPNEIEVDKQGNQILCPVCQGTGYVGRTGVFELLAVDKDIRALIAKSTPLPTIKAEARKKGMLYLQEVALRKVYEGLTSINEVLRITKEDTPAPVAKTKAE
ncbi:MAG TPA: ATPase, T2SS/T4P/T4SS family [Phycisphaerae bacterium]|nr:ATPase, T2SS/T4P/T4SS family [Phycisphaerae bacterium]